MSLHLQGIFANGAGKQQPVVGFQVARMGEAVLQILRGPPFRDVPVLL